MLPLLMSEQYIKVARNDHLVSSLYMSINFFFLPLLFLCDLAFWLIVWFYFSILCFEIRPNPVVPANLEFLALSLSNAGIININHHT